MFPGRYFPNRFFPSRYWPKVGAVLAPAGYFSIREICIHPNVEFSVEVKSSVDSEVQINPDSLIGEC